MLTGPEYQELLKLRRLVQEQEKTIEQQSHQLRQQQIQIENLTQALLHARKKIFGPSTEVTQIEGQLSLFDAVDTPEKIGPERSTPASQALPGPTAAHVPAAAARQGGRGDSRRGAGSAPLLAPSPQKGPARAEARCSRTQGEGPAARSPEELFAL